MITISRQLFTEMVVAIFLLGGWFIGTILIFRKGKMKKETERKWKKICEWECRDSIEQEHIIIEEYVERYAKEKSINWSEYI